MDRLDAELIESLHAGDERALGELLARHTPGIYRFGLKMCRDPEDAKDVVQDTLLAAARGIRARGASSLSTWLYTAARRFCIKKRRSAKNGAAVLFDEEPVALETPSSAIPPDEAAADHQLGAALERAIASLDPMYREVLVLRDVEGLSAVEVAEVLGISAQAVKSGSIVPVSKCARRSSRSSPPRSARPAPSRRAYAQTSSPSSRGISKTKSAPSECASMELHVASCKRCNPACESLKHSLALCRAEPQGEVPADVQARVRKALSELATSS